MTRVLTWGGWGTIVSIATAIAAIATLYYTSKSLDANTLQIEQSRRGQVSERLIKAGDQIASEKAESRIVGLYSLETIANESPADQATVVEVIASFVRSRAELLSASKTDCPIQSTQDTGPEAIVFVPFRLADDVQVALTILGRRDVDQDRPDRRADLSRTCLAKANLVGANLSNFDFDRTVLTGTDLTGADLQNSTFTETSFEQGYQPRTPYGIYGTILEGADLSGSVFDGTRFHGVDLDGAIMRNAEFKSVDLRGINLENCDLSGSSFNFVAWDEDTKWPPGFIPPPTR